MSRSPATCLVQLTQFSGVEVNAHLVLDKQPTRQDIKLKTLSNYVQQHPSGWKKRLELADLLYSMGQWQEAVGEYRQVLKRQPHLMEVRLQLGKILQLMGKKSEAIAVYQSALFLSHNVATQLHINGLIEVCRSCQDQAVRLFESAASLEPNNPAHWYALGQVHLQTESPVAALRSFDAILSHKPDEIVALNWSYEPLLAVGNFQEAQRRLEQALKLDPHDCLTLERLATHRCYQGLVLGKEGKQTRQLIRATLGLAPDSANAHQVLSLYHLRRGEWGKSVAVLLQFTQQHPHNPGGWYHYARCLFQTGNFQAAADAILKAYGFEIKDCEIYRALWEILPVAGRLAELHQLAIKSTIPPSPLAFISPTPHLPLSPVSLLEEMLNCFSQRWSVWVSAGRVLVENFKDIERGCRVSAMGVQLQPQLADAWFRHGRVLALAQRHQLAVEAIEHGWQWLPQEGGYLQSVSAAVWLGESYQTLGNDALSRKWWEEGCQRAQALMEFNPPTAYYWQGRALSALGDLTSAARAYRRAISQHLPYPACQEVKQALKHV